MVASIASSITEQLQWYLDQEPLDDQIQMHALGFVAVLRAPKRAENARQHHLFVIQSSLEPCHVGRRYVFAKLPQFDRAIDENGAGVLGRAFREGIFRTSVEGPDLIQPPEAHRLGDDPPECQPTPADLVAGESMRAEFVLEGAAQCVPQEGWPDMLEFRGRVRTLQAMAATLLAQSIVSN